ncbi:hypothetical protein [Actinomadura algeriensis]|uniref:SUKH-4 immunity protein of toxin-antitoxin system n=1 Tax=Actinomadura algeriensis TaxID=1679523 RepID=A0ABR9K2G4_9ACTN|nr:hypothetical protein [Actinomadura algeriensis]MBE1537050.1 hypothetical protein [Actinomadura algeriensis]
MSLSEALATLADTWPDTVDDLPESVLEALAAAESDTDSAAVAKIVRALMTGLPADHPARRPLAGGWRLVPSGGRSGTALERLRDAARGELGVRSAAGRLLAAPMVAWADVRVPDADRDALVRLTSRDGADGAPAFQFDEVGNPVPVVLEINRLLDAAGDPWGVADWWLCGNAWLRGTPADLLGTTADADLLAAAHAELAVV